jgi:aminopeptidase N
MGYTSPENSFEVRQNAFALITEVFTLPDEGLKDLVNASVHHSWQFRQYARDLLGRIMKDEKQKERVVRLSQELNGEELRYIRGKLESE